MNIYKYYTIQIIKGLLFGVAVGRFFLAFESPYNIISGCIAVYLSLYVIFNDPAIIMVKEDN